METMTKLTGEQIVDAIKNPRIVVAFSTHIECTKDLLYPIEGVLIYKGRTLSIVYKDPSTKQWESLELVRGRYSVLHYLNEHKRDITIVT